VAANAETKKLPWYRTERKEHGDAKKSLLKLWKRSGRLAFTNKRMCEEPTTNTVVEDMQ
jgi:hypothetical protein